jgi:hypothetical protein
MGEYGGGSGPGAAKGALFGVAAAPAGGFDMGLVLLGGGPEPMVQQGIGTGQRRAGPEKDGQENGGDEPAPHEGIIQPRGPAGQLSAIGNQLLTVVTLSEAKGPEFYRYSVGPFASLRVTTPPGE